MNALTSFDKAQSNIARINSHVLGSASVSLGNIVTAWIDECYANPKVMRRTLTHLHPAIDYMSGGHMLSLNDYAADYNDAEWLGAYIDDLDNAAHESDLNIDSVLARLRKIEGAG